MGASITADAAKRGFGALLDRVESTGTPVTVTRRNKPVAVIEPIASGREASLENEAYGRGVRGLVTKKRV